MEFENFARVYLERLENFNSGEIFGVSWRLSSVITSDNVRSRLKFCFVLRWLMHHTLLATETKN